MKESPENKKNAQNMKPGVISLSGFLGKDTRDLIQIIIDDDAAVKRSGISHGEIAARMIYFRDKGSAGLGEYITVDTDFEVKVESVRGKMPSPFNEDHKIISKTNIAVRNKKLNKELTYTNMLIHLISSHGFYEGKGSPYRISPGEIIEILEITSPLT